MKNIAKRTLFLIAAFLLFFSLAEALVLRVYTGRARALSGDGSATYPYRIKNCADFHSVLENHPTSHVSVMNDMFDCGSWTPISTFSGTLDGRNHQVYNVNVNQPGVLYAGVFAYLAGTVKNITFGNTYITGGGATGGLAGSTGDGATISNVRVNATVVGEGLTGGLVGAVNGVTTIQSSSTVGTLTANTGSRIGGLVGGLDAGTVSDSYSSMAITTDDSVVGVGGLVGWLFEGTSINRSYFDGSITDGSNTGGLVGLANQYGGAQPVISNSFSVGTLSSVNASGGLVGLKINGNATLTNNYFDANKADITDCISTGAESGCTAVNTDGSDADHFKNTTSVEPFTTGGWDFTNVWQSTTVYPFPRYATPDTLEDLPLPNRPQNLNANTGSGPSVDLSWDAPELNASGDVIDYRVDYRLWTEDNSEGWATFDEGVSTNTTATVTGLTPSTQYEFRVLATTEGGDGEPSESATAESGVADTSISSCEELQNIKYAPEESYSLTGDINCSDTSNWNYDADNDVYLGFDPIQNFSGTLDGNGHSILFMTIRQSESGIDTGMFGQIVDSATIRNLTIRGSFIVGQYYTGALAGYAEAATVRNVNVLDTSVNSTYGSAGLLIGDAEVYQDSLTISRVRLSGAVYNNLAWEDVYGVGGAIGYLLADEGSTVNVTNITAAVEVVTPMGNNSFGAGGIVGEVDAYDDAVVNLSGLKVENGSSIDANQGVGGLIGDLYTYYNGNGDSPGVINLRNSSAISEIEGTDYVGGLVGSLDTYGGGTIGIQMSYSQGSISSDNGYAGGLIGTIYGEDDPSIEITASYSSSDVYAPTGNSVGGLIGENAVFASVSNSYATGSVTGARSVGGLVGFWSGGIIDSTYSSGNVEVTEDGGAGGLIGSSDDAELYDSFSVSHVFDNSIMGAYTGGLVGIVNNSESLIASNNYFAPDLTGMSQCISNYAVEAEACAPLNAVSGDFNNYFEAGNEPMTQWDFTDVWVEHEADYPTLMAYDTSNSPVIRNCYQLQAIDEDLSGNYTLANDIDCYNTISWNDGQGFSPIGKQSDEAFTGTFDGNGHTIRGLYEQSPVDWADDFGMFAYIEGGSVIDVTLDDFFIGGSYYANGALAAHLRTEDGEDANIMNVAVTNAYVSGENATGGLIGRAVTYNNGEYNMDISNNSFEGTVYTPYDPESFGGLIGELGVGESSLTFHDNTVEADVSAEDGWSVGGLVGNLWFYPGASDLDLHDLSSSGSVEGEGEVGGLFGSINGNYEGYRFSRFSLTDSSSTSEVTGREDTGGLIGDMEMQEGVHGILRNVHAEGDVYSYADDYYYEEFGGLIGSVDGDDYSIEIKQSYATGDVQAEGNYDVGGLIGYSSDVVRVTNSYATGDVAGYIEVGGLIGGGEIFATNSYATGDVIGTEEIGGFGGEIDSGTFVNNFAAGAVASYEAADYIGGFIGNYYEDPDYPDDNTVLINNYYDEELAGISSCAIYDNNDYSGLVNNDEGECEPVNGGGSSPLQFKDDPVHQPLTQWNFEGIWQANDNDYPTLDDSSLGASAAPGVPTSVQVTGEPEDIDLTWDAPVDNGGSAILGYIVQIKDHSDDYWESVAFTTDTEYSTTKDILEDSVDGPNFDFRVMAVNETSISDPSATVNLNLAESYDISSCEELQGINDDLSGMYTLTQDIECSDTADWNDGQGFIPIGHDGYNDFNGTFNGNGHKIKNLFMDWSESDTYYYGGLFYYTVSATLDDFVMEGGSITMEGSSGAVAAFAENTTVSNVASNMRVTSLSSEAGGLFGEYYAYSGNPSDFVLSESYSTGAVEGSYDVGGLVGWANGITIDNSYYNGDVSGSSSSVGGLVGYGDEDLIIRDSYAAGEVYGDSYVGGLVGDFEGDSIVLDHLFADNSVWSEDYDSTGAIIGINDAYGSIFYSETYYDSTHDTLSCQGLASEGGTAGCSDTGGLVDFINNSADSPMSGWDFDTVWMTEEGKYPQLQVTGLAITATSITDCEGLQAMQNDLTASYELANDIDCTESATWNDGAGFIPVGPNPSEFFIGSLDGNGHKITNLTIFQPENPFVGLFGFAPEAQISNLNLEDAYIVGGDYTGGVAGVLLYGGSLENVTVDGDINGVSAIGFVGGMDIPVVGVGGLVGVLDAAEIRQSSVTGAVTGHLFEEDGFNNTGGLVGQMIESAYMGDSYSSAEVTAASAGAVTAGGAVGFMSYGFEESDPSIVENIYTNGSVAGSEGNLIAGLVAGVFQGVVVNSYAAAAVETSEATFSGGLIGQALNGDMIFNNYLDVGRAEIDYCGMFSDDDDGGCTPVNTEEEPDPDYFFGNEINPPLNEWNFGSIWQTREDKDPILRGALAPATEITNCDELQAINDDLGGDYVLANDIDCSETAEWNFGAGFEPIGEPMNPFTGALDGNGFTVSGLYINRQDSDFVGIFGFLGHSEVTDLNIAEAFIVGGDYTGALAGVAVSATITGVRTEAYTAGLTHQTPSDGPVLVGVGGLVGLLESSTVSSSATFGSVEAVLSTEFNGHNAGGIAGIVTYNSLITDSYSEAYVVANSVGIDFTAGGIAGLLWAAAEEDGSVVGNVYSDGSVVDLGDNTVAGLIGKAYYATVDNSYSAATVSTEGTNDAGLISYVHSSSTDDLYIDAGRSGMEGCYRTVDSGGYSCNLINTMEEQDDDYFFDNTDHPPLNEWDFDVTWSARSDDDPELRAFVAPQEYNITDCEQLQAIQNDPDGDYTLANDIDCSDTLNWNDTEEDDITRGFEPIEGFTGSLDGQGHSITDLYIYRPETTNVGLFGTVEGGSITDLSIELGDFSFINGGRNVAMLVGSMLGGSLYDVSVEGNVYATEDTAGLVAGYAECTDDNPALSIDTISISGILEYEGGYNYGSLVGGVESNSSDCIPDLHDVDSLATIIYTDYETDFGGSYVGGLVGYIYANEDANTTILRDSSFDGEISGVEFYAGGIIGGASSYGDDLQITRVHSSANIEVDPNSDGIAGGVAGEIGGLVTVSESYSTGDITGPGNIGGLVGNMYTNDNTPLVQGSYATGDVTENVGGGNYLGGLVGTMGNGAVIDSYATGDIVLHGNSSSSGGLIGYAFGYVSNSYATGNVGGTADGLNLGGLIGEMTGESLIERNYATGDVDGGNNLGGLLGYIEGEGQINNTYATGSVTGLNFNIGGLVGQFGSGSSPNPAISNSYASGSVTGDENVGGLVGAVMGTVSNSFAVGAVSGEVTNRTGGIFGLFDGMDGGLSVNNYWDVTRTGQPYCSDSYSVIGCESVIDAHPINTADAPSANYFKNNDSNPPLDAWDFDDTWVKNKDQYPLFQVLGSETGGGSSGGSTTPKPAAKKTTKSATKTSTEGPKEVKILLNDFNEYTNGQGKTLEGLKVGQVIHFNVNKNGVTEAHTATIKEVGSDYVIFTIASTPFDVRVMLGETKVVSIDGVAILNITVNSIENGVVSATFNQIASGDALTTAASSESGEISTIPAEQVKSVSAGLYAALTLALLGLVLLAMRKKHRHHKKSQ